MNASPTAERSPLTRRTQVALVCLLVGTAALYLIALSVSGYGNSYYAAAAQAGATSWKAWFFGSLDGANAITVDKPPASLWAMGLSVRIFGLSSWSVLVPQALMGVGTTYLTWAFARRVVAPPWALAAAAAAALTPAATLMFRFNNPDALLLLLLLGAGVAMLDAVQTGRTRWLVIAGALVGLAFLVKMLQAFLVLPVFVAVYLGLGPNRVGRRVRQLLAAAAAMVAAAAWWVAIVMLWPASARPYIDGTSTNNVLELVLGYNGLGRLTGDEYGGHGNAGFSSAPGLFRLFGGMSGGMISWLLPAALIGLVGALIARRRAPRTDLTRAALLISSGSMLVTAAVFSTMAGIYHDYYTVALAPWITLTAAIGAAVLWDVRDRLPARATLAAMVLTSGSWAFVLLGQSGREPYAALRWLVLAACLVASASLVRAPLVWPPRRALMIGTLVGLSVLAGPAAYSTQTAASRHAGFVVTAGPYKTPLIGAEGGYAPKSPDAVTGRVVGRDAERYTWAAATVGSVIASRLQLVAGAPVLSIGGFNSTSPSMTLAEFQALVREGRIHWFVPGGWRVEVGGVEGNGDGAGTYAPTGPFDVRGGEEITRWVKDHFPSLRVGNSTLYDLTRPLSPAPRASGR